MSVILADEYHVVITVFCTDSTERLSPRSLQAEIIRYSTSRAICRVVDSSTPFHTRIKAVLMDRDESRILHEKLKKSLHKLPCIIEIEKVFSTDKDRPQEIVEEGVISKKLYLSGLPNGVEHQQLFTSLSKFGAVKQVYMSRKFRRGSYFYGFVIFHEEESASKVMNEKRILINKKWVKPKITKQDDTAFGVFAPKVISVPTANHLKSANNNLKTKNLQSSIANLICGAKSTKGLKFDRFWKVAEISVDPFKNNRILTNITVLHDLDSGILLQLNRSSRDGLLAAKKTKKYHYIKGVDPF